MSREMVSRLKLMNATTRVPPRLMFPQALSGSQQWSET